MKKYGVLLVLLCTAVQGAAGVHHVRRGETLWGLSRRYGITVNAMRRANPALAGRALRAGMRLHIPEKHARQQTPRSRTPVRQGTPAPQGRAGVWYQVKAGDSWWSLSRRFGTSVAALRSMNGDRALLKGQRIRIAGQPDRIAVAHSSRPARQHNVIRKTRGAYFGSIPANLRIQLSWPLKGPIVEQFGLGNKWISNGITIRQSSGRMVRAAAGGVVAFQGHKRGYGRMVIIRHANNIYSVYTNLGEVRVQSGQRIERQSPIGTTGALSSVGGHGLHFELYYRTKPVNPVRYLG